MKTVPKRNHTCVHDLPLAIRNFFSAGQEDLVCTRLIGTTLDWQRGGSGYGNSGDTIGKQMFTLNSYGLPLKKQV